MADENKVEEQVQITPEQIKAFDLDMQEVFKKHMLAIQPGFNVVPLAPDAPVENPVEETEE